MPEMEPEIRDATSVVLTPKKASGRSGWKVLVWAVIFGALEAGLKALDAIDLPPYLAPFVPIAAGGIRLWIFHKKNPAYTVTPSSQE